MSEVTARPTEPQPLPKKSKTKFRRYTNRKFVAHTAKKFCSIELRWFSCYAKDTKCGWTSEGVGCENFIKTHIATKFWFSLTFWLNARSFNKKENLFQPNLSVSRTLSEKIRQLILA